MPKSMSPDVFLSRNGIRYDGNGMPGSPAQIVDALVKLNATRIWNEDTGEFDQVVYEPDFVAVGMNPNTFSSQWINKESAARAAYDVALKTGSLGKVHAAVDAINAVRQIKGGASFQGASDFEILANGNNAVGNVAKYLVSEWQSAVDNGGNLPWFWTRTGYDALNAYAAE